MDRARGEGRGLRLMKANSFFPLSFLYSCGVNFEWAVMVPFLSIFLSFGPFLSGISVGGGRHGSCRVYMNG